jgi:peptide/nickel transport system substrate-binding protein
LAASVLAVTGGGCGSSTATSGERAMHVSTATVDVTWSSLSLDPAWTYSPSSDSVLGLTNDGLVGFRRAGGAAGNELVPDLATAMPVTADGGRTWTATLRSGIVYSTGQPVRASDVRRALERDFRLRSDGLFALRKLVGASTCDSAPATCSLADGVITDDRRGTIEFRLTDPDPEFPFVLALPLTYPLPPGIPRGWAGVRALPGTGPYAVASYIPGERVELVRNPRFRQWSAAAQPQGEADRIVYRLSVPADKATEDLVQGRSVSLIGQAPSVSGLTVSRLPDRATLFLELNTRSAPFKDVRARRAFALVLDQPALLRAAGWSGSYAPACHLVPPSIPGASDAACPRPAVERARRLVRASGTRGATVAVAIDSSDGRLGPLIVRTLRSIGYRARLDPAAVATFENSDNPAQVSLFEWRADYPSPANFYGALLACDAFLPGTLENENGSRFCDPRLDELIATAVAAGGLDPAAAAQQWRAVDRFVVDQAPVIPVGYSRDAWAASPSAPDVAWNVQWGPILQLVRP